VLTCGARIAGKRREGGECYVDLDLWAENRKGELVAKGASSSRIYLNPDDEDRQRRGLAPLGAEEDRPSLVEALERELPGGGAWPLSLDGGALAQQESPPRARTRKQER
jgi:hypothetical protein